MLFNKPEGLKIVKEDQRLIGLIVDRSNSDRLRGFCDRQMDICDCRVAFATENDNQIKQEHLSQT